MLELADIFRRYGPEYRKKFKDILPSHRKAMADIEQCRTEPMGGHVYYCNRCKESLYSYHSCKNRHCPKCLNGATTIWLQKQKKLLLPVNYFLVTFTLPEELRMIARSNQKTLYKMFFNTSAQALEKLAWDKRFVGGRIGMVGVLHTWSRDMGYHVHVHYIVPGGGLSQDNTTWMKAGEKFLVRVEPLSIIFKAKFKEELEKTELFDQVPSKVWKKNWVVHSKPVGKGIKALQYLSKYVYRVAISNSRLIKLENDEVTFKYQDSDTKEWKTRSLHALEFIRRFLQHVLPKGFQKVKRAGLFTTAKKKLLAVVRYILRPLGAPEEITLLDSPQTVCPTCGSPLMVLGTIPRIRSRPP